MIKQTATLLTLMSCFVALWQSAFAAVAGDPGDELTIAQNGKTVAVVVVSANAGKHEKKAAEDLAKYIGLMCGDAPKIVGKIPADATPALVVGQAAIGAVPKLKNRIAAKLKKKPYLRTDGIAVVRDGNRVYLAGNHDPAHYYAAAELLSRWGCRWYTPTEFGECIPDERNLSVGKLDHVYSSPFEIRSYWISWVGDNAGRADFQLRNMMTGREDMPPTGHALGKYTKGLGKGTFHFPITDPNSAKHVASKVESQFAAGKNFSLGMEDGSYSSDYPKDKKLMKLQYDKYFMRESVSDLMLELYNNVAKTLQKKYPQSNSKIGFLAYANMTIPPVRDMTAERSLYCELAPIDIDPIHGMDDPQSPPRQEYKRFVYKWAKIMQGRLAIYDYDQGMLVWRDVPNPSHMAFRQDVQHYRNAGVLGVNTESRNAIATTFLNLYFRGQLLWNPDADVDALLDEFYPKFFGPAAEPMREYWTTIYDAWENSIVTEHEYFVFPAIYTPDVMQVLDKKIIEAERAIAALKKRGARTRNEKRYVERMRFMRYSHDVTSGYDKMVRAAARDCDYSAAVRHGEKTLAIREKLTDMNGIFTTYRGYNVEKNGYAWWPGEVRQYRELSPLVDGTKGQLIAKLPLELPLRRDHDGSGLKKGYANQEVDLSEWNAQKDSLTLDNRKDWGSAWEMVRSDLYPHAQGVRHPDRQSYTGTLWYRLDSELAAVDANGPIRLKFPGVFSECWCYVNGKKVAHREANPIWWYNDYRFEWEVDLTGKVKAGKNQIALRVNNPHHFGGIFRRPFFYKPVQ